MKHDGVGSIPEKQSSGKRAKFQCPSCHEWLPKNNFAKDFQTRTSERNNWCNSCKKDFQKSFAKVRKQEPVLVDSSGKGRFPWYGITEADYKEMLEHQGGVCAGCGRLPNPEIRLNIDHRHQPGDKKRLPWERSIMVRGLLCHLCNRVLGILRDRPDTFKNLARYLEHPPAESVVFPKLERAFKALADFKPKQKKALADFKPKQKKALADFKPKQKKRKK